jgi:hypothetical protein
VTPAERAQRIQAMRDQLLAEPMRMSRATVMYWTEFLVDIWSTAVPPSVDALETWISTMDCQALDSANYWGPPEGWDGDDEGGAA